MKLSPVFKTLYDGLGSKGVLATGCVLATVSNLTFLHMWSASTSELFDTKNELFNQQVANGPRKLLLEKHYSLIDENNKLTGHVEELVSKLEVVACERDKSKLDFAIVAKDTGLMSGDAVESFIADSERTLKTHCSDQIVTYSGPTADFDEGNYPKSETFEVEVIVGADGSSVISLSPFDEVANEVAEGIVSLTDLAMEQQKESSIPGFLTRDK